MHFACLQDKADNGGITELSQNFFSSPEDASKYLDFNNTKNVFEMDKDCLGINKNKFNILFHKRFYLQEGEGKDGVRKFTMGESNYMKTINIYHTINKNIEFENKAAIEPMKNIRYAYWFVPRYSTDNPIAGQTDEERAVHVDIKQSVLYKDRL